MIPRFRGAESQSVFSRRMKEDSSIMQFKFIIPVFTHPLPPPKVPPVPLASLIPLVSPKPPVSLGKPVLSEKVSLRDEEGERMLQKKVSHKY